MSVRRCQAEVDSAEFAEWLAYGSIERFGPVMDDLRMGAIAAAIYNVNRDTKLRVEPFGPADVFGWMAATTPANEPVLLADAAEQTAMMKAKLFGSRRRIGAKNGGEKPERIQ
ncbi:hypothetical protein WT11_01120 [Burkholderia stagnalis]|uniref:phage tail assembly protein T n=1 Tax=Burkholderia stagnalis TaxID=1503054 RepID=UPI0007569048|nr:hypothetical protein [Burkholderia stagnalis]KVN31725.1 hypothetical protein WT11_01120 [Burkholderia stagnalis]